MASVTATPDYGVASEGEKIVVTGEGFKANTAVTVAIPELGITEVLTTDYGGYFSTDKYAKHAGGVLTVAGATVPTAAQTLTIGAVTYTWRAAVTTTANEILIGDDAPACLANLKAAINLDTSLGAVYGSATVVHPTVHAGELTSTTLTLQAKTGGTGGNSLASTSTTTSWTFGGATLANGAAAGSTDPLSIRPETTKPFTVTATDGTNSASTSVKVWTK